MPGPPTGSRSGLKEVNMSEREGRIATIKLTQFIWLLFYRPTDRTIVHEV